MKKEAKVEFGIQIVKPWSTEMYAHNEALAEVVKAKVEALWVECCNAAEAEFVAEDELGNEFAEQDWSEASRAMLVVQMAVTGYRFGYGYTIDGVSDRVLYELDIAPLYRLKEIAEELELELETGFVGFN